jgi:hypothetical protein
MGQQWQWWATDLIRISLASRVFRGSNNWCSLKSAGNRSSSDQSKPNTRNCGHNRCHLLTDRHHRFFNCARTRTSFWNISPTDVFPCFSSYDGSWCQPSSCWRIIIEVKWVMWCGNEGHFRSLFEGGRSSCRFHDRDAKLVLVWIEADDGLIVKKRYHGLTRTDTCGNRQDLRYCCLHYKATFRSIPFIARPRRVVFTPKVQ